MPKEEVERLVGRAVLDAKFRERLFADPEKTVLEEGFDLTDEEMETLKRVDPQKAQAAIEDVVEPLGQPWSG